MELKINNFWDKWSDEEREAVVEIVEKAAYIGADGAVKGYTVGMLTAFAMTAIGGLLLVPAYDKLLDWVYAKKAAQKTLTKPDTTDSE